MLLNEALKQVEESVMVQLKQAKALTDLRTLGIQRKAFVKHALELAISKQTPKLVVQTYIESDTRVFDCPLCKNTWMYTNTPEEFRYCPTCGQKLDWDGNIELEEGE